MCTCTCLCVPSASRGGVRSAGVTQNHRLKTPKLYMKGYKKQHHQTNLCMNCKERVYFISVNEKNLSIIK